MLTLDRKFKCSNDKFITHCLRPDSVYNDP